MDSHIYTFRLVYTLETDPKAGQPVFCYFSNVERRETGRIKSSELHKPHRRNPHEIVDMLRRLFIQFSPEPKIKK